MNFARIPDTKDVNILLRAYDESNEQTQADKQVAHVYIFVNRYL